MSKGDLLRRNARRAVKVRAQAHGMHARVGPARAGDGDGFARQAGKRLLQRLLYARPVNLALPAAVVRAVVFDDQAESLQSLCRMIRLTGAMLAGQYQRRLIQGACPPR